MNFSRSVGLLGKLDPVRKSFDFNPLATLVQAGLASAPKSGGARLSSDVSIFYATACASEKAIPRSCWNLREFALVFVNLRKIAGIFVKLRKIALNCVKLHIELQLQLGAVSIDQRVVDPPFVPGCGRLLVAQWLN